MTLNEIASIGTTVGAIAAAGSLVSGFALYRFSQTDAFANNAKRILSKSREACQQLNRMVTYDLAHETVNTVVFSPTVTFYLDKVWRKFFNKEDQREVLEDYMKQEFPPITVPVDTPILRRIDEITKETQSDLAYIQNDFPGLYRVISPILSVLTMIVTHHKTIPRSGDLWEKLIPSVYEGHSFESLPDLQYRIQIILVGLLNKRVNEHDQEDIDDLLSLLNMTTDAYLSLDAARLKRMSALERKQSFRPMQSTEKISDDLREAEKAMKHVLSDEQMLKYRELVVKFEERNSDKQSR